jgi:uncharacterized protein (DUF488 family)
VAILTRQKVFLYALRQGGGRASHLAATKWCFLIWQESRQKGGSAFYRFVPYKYGPFSFSLYHEASNLASLGLLEESDAQTWAVTEAGIRQANTLPNSLKREIESIVTRYGDQSPQGLIDIVYERYPWFTILSDMVRRRAGKPPRAESNVYTMGYEGLLIDDFLNRLLENGIHRVIDVRNNPIARRYGFHKSSLSRLCGRLAIEYCHFPDLGIPSQERKTLTSADQYELLFKRYRDEIIPRRSTSVREVAEAMQAEPSVLVCTEADPRFCHRTHLAQVIAARIGRPICHLEWPR